MAAAGAVSDEKWAEKARHLLDPKEPSGYVGRLTLDEESTMNTVKQALAKERPGYTMEDKDILRFCRAREFRPKDSIKMLLSAIEWFETNKPGDADYKICRVCFDAGTLLPSGHDKKGRPIIWMMAKNHIPKDHSKTIPPAVFRITEDSLKNMGGEMESIALVFDLTGWTMKNSDMGAVYQCVQSFQHYYPERLGLVLIVNAPYIFSCVWSVIKGWLAPRTANKIMFLGGDYKEKLHFFIERDNIPLHLGGTSEATPKDFIVGKAGKAPPPSKQEHKGWFRWGKKKKTENEGTEELDTDKLEEELQAKAANMSAHSGVFVEDA